MSVFSVEGTIGKGSIVEFICQERSKSLSAREWKHRIAGYGYRVRDTARGQVIENITSGRFICDLPGDAA